MTRYDTSRTANQRFEKRVLGARQGHGPVAALQGYGAGPHVLRRRCVTFFGAKAKDLSDTQAQLRHADPSVTLRSQNVVGITHDVI